MLFSTIQKIQRQNITSLQNSADEADVDRLKAELVQRHQFIKENAPPQAKQQLNIIYRQVRKCLLRNKETIRIQ